MKKQHNILSATYLVHRDMSTIVLRSLSNENWTGREQLYYIPWLLLVEQMGKEIMWCWGLGACPESGRSRAWTLNSQLKPLKISLTASRPALFPTANVDHYQTMSWQDRHKMRSMYCDINYSSKSTQQLQHSFNTSCIENGWSLINEVISRYWGFMMRNSRR